MYTIIIFRRKSRIALFDGFVLLELYKAIISLYFYVFLVHDRNDISHGFLVCIGIPDDREQPIEFRKSFSIPIECDIQIVGKRFIVFEIRE